MALIVPDEVYTLARRAEEHADALFDGYEESHDREETWRQGYANGYARAVQHMANWALGNAPADTLRDFADRLQVDL